MAANLTAKSVVEGLRREVGRSWLGGTSERFESGNDRSTVEGVATVWTPSIESLQKAISLKHNLILSMEPPFWQETSTVNAEVSYGPPAAQALEASPAYQMKKKLIDDHALVIWRFNENYRALASNPRLNGLAQRIGYKPYEDAAATKAHEDIGAGVYDLPTTSLMDLAKNVRERGNAKALRVLGNPDASIRRVALLPGYMTDEDVMAMVANHDIDAIVCGESCEWEGFVYCEDWITAGWGKGLVMMGRAASEDPGQMALAEWIKSFISDVPVTGIEVGEPFNYVPSHRA